MPQNNKKMIVDLIVHRTSDAEYFEAFQEQNSRLIRKFMNECRRSFNAAICKAKGDKSDEFLDELMVVSITRLWTRVTNQTLTLNQLESSLKNYLIGIGMFVAEELEDAYSSIKEKREGEKKMIEFQCQECGKWIEWTNEEYKCKKKKAPICCGAKMERVVSHKQYIYDEEPSIDKQMWDSVTKALEKITSKCKEILTLIYWDRKAYEEILGLTSYKTIDSAKTQKYKCLQKIKVAAIQIYNRSKN